MRMRTVIVALVLIAVASQAERDWLLTQMRLDCEWRRQQRAGLVIPSPPKAEGISVFGQARDSSTPLRFARNDRRRRAELVSLIERET